MLFYTVEAKNFIKQIDLDKGNVTESEVRDMLYEEYDTELKHLKDLGQTNCKSLREQAERSTLKRCKQWVKDEFRHKCLIPNVIYSYRRTALFFYTLSYK